MRKRSRLIAGLLGRRCGRFRRGRSQSVLIGVLVCGVTCPASAGPTLEELVLPPICSAAAEGDPTLKAICTVTLLGGNHNKVEVHLKAQTSTLSVAGYKVETDNYNGAYLTPVIEVMPGDTVAAHLVNTLSPRPHAGMMQGDMNENPTNLHLFHGGIVSPNNARPKDAATGNGDNVYVHLKPGPDGSANSFDFEVPVPGEGALDARVLEADGSIAHPTGLNWYHSHMHGISHYQVMGGLSGLLSVGDGTANVRAACVSPPTCTNDVEKDTAALKTATDVRYALLRDLPLETNVPPDKASDTPATWAPDSWDPRLKKCGVWKTDNTGPDFDPKLRLGFCQRDQSSVWLFTVNGQRFPTITVDGGRNLELRMGNLSSDAPYWLELQSEDDGTILPLTLLSLDGVVPERALTPEQAGKPVAAKNVDDLLLMPASRAEIYVRNDGTPHDAPRTYILQTKEFKVAQLHKWPAIRLARIVLKPNVKASRIALGLNAAVARVNAQLASVAPKATETVSEPPGCMRDLDPSRHEYRRVAFEPGKATPEDMKTVWRIRTEIIQPIATGPARDEGDQPADPATTIAHPFETYVKPDGSIDWMKPNHVCIKLDHAGSHKQLWVLANETGDLHNFHIHQMKFRLATKAEIQSYNIIPPEASRACEGAPTPCPGPDYKFYDDTASPRHSSGTIRFRSRRLSSFSS